MAKPQRRAIEDHAPWRPPEFEQADVVALQALAQGKASIEQQKRALAWIVGSDHRGFHNSACGYYDLSYRPGTEGERDTAFAEGRRFVGAQIVKLLKLKVGLLYKPKTSEGER